MTTTPTASTRRPGASSGAARCIGVAVPASSMSIAAHAAGGADPGILAVLAVVVTTTILSAGVLRRMLPRTAGRAGLVGTIASVVLLDQFLGHALLHAEHLLSSPTTGGQPSMHAAHAMVGHSGHGMPAAHTDHPTVAMLAPTPTMAAAHVVGALLAGLLIATAFVLADRIAQARHRVLSRPPVPRAAAATPLLRAAVLGSPLSGHVRLGRSRGPPLALV